MSTTPAAAPATVEVLVKYSAGAYYTNTVAGKRASSTVSAGQAVQRLTRKLWGAEGQTTFVGLKSLCELWVIAPQSA
jgi:hypothetical protein